MSDITIIFPTLQNVHNYSGDVKLRFWYTGCVGQNFITSDGITAVMCGTSQGNWYVEADVAVVGSTLNVDATVLTSTDNSNTASVLCSAQFYVNDSPADFFFQDWIITATLGTTLNWSQLWIYNQQATPAYTLSAAYLTAPQVAALILATAAQKANVSPLVDPVNGHYGITALSVAPASSDDPIARGINDITNPFLISRTGVPAVSGVTAQGLDIALTGTQDSLDFGGLMGAKVALTWNGTGSAFHQTLQPLVARATHSGTGRIDFANGATVTVANSGNGILQAPQAYSGVVQNLNASVMGQGAVYFADWFQSGTASVSTYSALFQGRFRNFSGTPTTPAVYGAYFTGWTKAGGSTVTLASVIKVDDSTRIGTTSLVIDSTSLADSLLQGGLTLGVNAATSGVLKFKGSTSGTVTLQPKAAAGTWSLTLPDTAGTSGFVLQTDGTGITSWVAQSGGGGSSPGGSNTQVQYNNAGTLGGITGATSNGTRFFATDPQFTAPVTLIGLGAALGTHFLKWNSGTGVVSTDNTAYTTSGGALSDLASIMIGDVTGAYSAVGPTFTTTIGIGKVTNTMLAGGITENKLVGTDIFRLGTITTGVWNAGNVTANGNLASVAATGNVFIKDASTGFQSATTLVVTPQANNSIRSTNFTSGLVGWGINALGDAEFANVDVRGAIHASVITYNAILATSGTLGVFKAAAKLLNDVIVTAGPTYGTTTFTIDVEDQDGLTHAASQLFVVNDILRLKDGLIGDTWFKVTAVSDQTTFWRYTASIQAGSNTVTYRAGLGVADYGQSGAGFIILTADQTNSPYEQMATHAATFTAASSAGTLILTPQLRLGNLNGSYGYASDIYGFAAGQYGAASKSWISVDQTNGIRIGNNTTQLAQWNVSGDILVGQQSAGQSNTFISAGAFSIRSNTTSLFNINTSGSVRIGTDISAAATTNLFVSNQAALYNSESFAVGDILIGDNTAASNFGNIKITAGAIKIRRGTTDYITLSATDAQFTNLIKMTGASAAISLGTTPPTSASAGTGIWIDRTGIYGLNTNVLQTKMDATGVISAGAGNVTLDAQGLVLAFAAAGTAAIRWASGPVSYPITIGVTGTATSPQRLDIIRATNDTGVSSYEMQVASSLSSGSIFLDIIADGGNARSFVTLGNNQNPTTKPFLGLMLFNGTYITDTPTLPAALLDVVSRDAATAAFTDAAVLRHNSTGTPAANFGVSILYTLNSSTTKDQNAARVGALWTDATHASRTSAVAVQTVNNAGALAEIARFGTVSNFFKGGDVASAGTITPTGNLFHVTGTTNITSVSGTGIVAGTKITIIFDGVLTFTDGSNLKLAGNFVTTADDTITLAYDGTNWYELCRSVN